MKTASLTELECISNRTRIRRNDSAVLSKHFRECQAFFTNFSVFSRKIVCWFRVVSQSTHSDSHDSSKNSSRLRRLDSFRKSLGRVATRVVRESTYGNHLHPYTIERRTDYGLLPDGGCWFGCRLGREFRSCKGRTQAEEGQAGLSERQALKRCCIAVRFLWSF